MGERLLRAREHGDIRENAEYDAAKDAQGLMEARIRILEGLLKDPDIIEAEDGDHVAPGTLVDWSYTVERVKPVVPADYYSGWRVTNGVLTRRSRLIVDVPASVKPRIHEQNVHFKRVDVESRGRHFHRHGDPDCIANPLA